MISDGCWSGKPAIIIGGGPSLRIFEWKRLRGIPRIIVINRALREVPTADVFMTEDARFIERYANAEWFRSFKGVKVFSCPDDSYADQVRALCHDITLINARDKSKGWSRSIADGLSMSSNSGVPALNLADILGADPIYCLGFDCRTEGARMANYHTDGVDGYPKDWAVGAHQAAQFGSDFTHWAALHLRRSGRRVVNVINPDFPSALTCWQAITFDEFASCLA